MTGEVFKTAGTAAVWLLLLLFVACEEKSGTGLISPEKLNAPETKIEKSVNAGKSSPSKTPEKEEAKKEVKADIDASFSEIGKEDGIATDIKYATKDNFTKKIIYPCGRCYLRPEAAQRIIKANEWLRKEHKLGLKMFDCYRPRPAQQRLWDVVPDPDYVTPPAKGSMHNRGLAVDLTLVDSGGKELNMGTPYDFFGVEAHTDNTSLPAEVLKNRKLLQQALEAQGFSGIRTEWWHFSLNMSAPLSDWEWPCNK